MKNKLLYSLRSVQLASLTLYDRSVEKEALFTSEVYMAEIFSAVKLD